MADIEIVGPFHWHLKHLHPCQGLCEGNQWWLRKHGKFPECKRTASYKYKGKAYCALHMGQVLIKEKLKDARTK